MDANKSKEGLRYDAGKARMDLLCPVAMEGVARVLEKGAKKYAAWNWAKGMPWSKVLSSLLRHIFKFMSGEDYDYDPKCPECVANTCINHTGLPHVDQIACNAMFLQRYFREYKNLDDRYKKEPDNETKKEN